MMKLLENEPKRNVDPSSATILFLYGLLTFIDLRIVGRIAWSELLLGPMLIYYILRFPEVRGILSGGCKTFLFLAALAIFGVAISDLIVNEVYITSFMRGISRYIVLIFLSALWVAIATVDRRHLRYYFFGLLLSSIINLFQVSEFDRQGIGTGVIGYDYWLTKITPMIACLSFFLGAVLRQYSVVLIAILLICFAALNGYNSGRSLAAIQIVTAVLILYISSREKSGRILSGVDLRRVSLLASVLVVFGGSIAYFSYTYLAPNGYLGVYQQKKFFDQADTRFGNTPWGILLGGRAVMIESAMAITDDPIFGVGSWNIERWHLIKAYAFLDTPIPREVQQSVDMTTAGHSVFFSAWATSGILVLPFWVYCIYLGLRLFQGLLERVTEYSLFLIYSNFLFFFTIFFNPFSLFSRNLFGVIIGFALVYESTRLRRETMKPQLQNYLLEKS
jgi:hypothetical protein